MDVEQRADQESRRPSDEDPERATEDPDQKADDASPCGSSEVFVVDLVHYEELPILVPGDHRRPLELDLTLRVELLEASEGLVGAAVLREVNGDHVVVAENIISHDASFLSSRCADGPSLGRRPREAITARYHR